MSLHRQDYEAKGKEWFANVMQDWQENLIVLAVGIVLGRFGFPWLF